MRIGLAFLLGTATFCLGADAPVADTPGVAEKSGMPDMAATLSQQVGAVFQRLSPAVVRVEATDRHGKLSGTGFFADPLGTVYTVSATIGDGRNVVVVKGGRKLPARVLATDTRSGVALLRVENPGGAFIPVGDSRLLRLASPVMAIGFPMDLASSPTFGIVGGFDRKFQGHFLVATHIRANMPVQNGFGGAPLLNLHGEVVGMVVAGLEGGAACFALPIEAAEKVRRDVMRFGEARPGWVGVTVESQPEGVVQVAGLGAETPAARAGLHEGDIVRQVGNVPIKTVEDILDASFYLTDGDFVPIRIVRDGQEIEYSVRATTHPSNARDGLHASSESFEFKLLTK